MDPNTPYHAGTLLTLEALFAEYGGSKRKAPGAPKNQFRLQRAARIFRVIAIWRKQTWRQKHAANLPDPNVAPPKRRRGRPRRGPDLSTLETALNMKRKATRKWFLRYNDAKQQQEFFLPSPGRPRALVHPGERWFAPRRDRFARQFSAGFTTGQFVGYCRENGYPIRNDRAARRLLRRLGLLSKGQRRFDPEQA